MLTAVLEQEFDRAYRNRSQEHRQHMADAGLASFQLQSIPECEAEALAWGYGLPPDDHLIACRAMWSHLLLHGVSLPAERRIILISGGAP